MRQIDRWHRWRGGPVGRVGVAVVLASVLLGCASKAPLRREPTGPVREAGGVWICEAREGTTGEPWDEAGTTWREGGGMMSSVQGTPWGNGRGYGSPTEEEAVREALTSAASAALDLLERRGLKYRDDRRAEIEARTVDTLLEGGEPSFPRVRIGGRIVERCRNERTGESAWRAKLLVQYPIGVLRGDVVNAKWERERILRDVEVLRASAAAHFTEGRWFDGELDLAHCLDLLRDAGTPPPGVPEWTGGAGERAGGVVTQGERAWRQEMEIRRTEVPLSVEPAGAIEVVEIGARGGAEASFRVTCEWRGESVPAVGVPMRYAVEGGAAAILDGAPVTDGEGIARCRILRAYGEPGEYRLIASVDADLIRNAGVATFGSEVTRGDGRGGGRPAHVETPEASERLFLVRGGHGTTICAYFTAERGRDAERARAGFVQRMANDGYLTQDCGPDVDVVVTVKVSLVTVVVPGSWSAEVTVEGTAFDQRFAREVGETALTVAEASEEGQRNAELRALQEAGRLLAVYFSERILTSGE